ncbi:glycosyltransferase [Psychrobacillus sp. FSL H8-0487]|uniref:glycosyltransferase n=1 Tax=Psychrobacillus sp. FSL H8-0487 TaxID=2921391 RepID=UPI0030FAFD79
MAAKEMFGKNEHILIKNAIPAKEYIYNDKIRKEVRTQYGLEKKFIIGHVGRLSYSKNHEFLLKIFVNIHEKNKDAILLLVGDGELRNDIEKKIEELGLKEHVILTGVRNDISRLLQAMDVFVFPSHFEGLGIVAIEAQASGLPCVISDTIPQEALITNDIKQVSLNVGVEVWAETILNYKDSFNRKNTYQEINNAGYDIKEESSKLEQLYLNNI